MIGAGLELEIIEVSDLLKTTRDELEVMLSDMPEAVFEILLSQINQQIDNPLAIQTDKYRQDLNTLKHNALEILRRRNYDPESFISGKQ